MINSKITGTGYCKVAVFDTHPHQNTPGDKLYDAELTVTLPGYSDLVWSTWDYNFQHTGTTEEQFWFMMLYPTRANNDFEWSQGYRENYQRSHITTVSPIVRTNQWQIFDNNTSAYTTIPSNWEYWTGTPSTFNNPPKLSFADDRVLPICWQSELITS